MYIIKQQHDLVEGKLVSSDVKLKFMWFRKIVCWCFENLHRKHYYHNGKKQLKTLQIFGLRTALVERKGQKSRTQFLFKLDIIERWKKFDELDFIVYGLFFMLIVACYFILYG